MSDMLYILEGRNGLRSTWQYWPNSKVAELVT